MWALRWQIGDMIIPPEGPIRVQILLWDGVELLDFAGPAEVFSAAGFTLEAVSVGGRPILSQGFLRVQPTGHPGLDDPPHIFVVPGGASEKASHDPEIRGVVLGMAKRVPVLFSVCTGAMVLARAGLLDGLEATTWHGALDDLRRCSPSIRVREGVRWVDQGHILTAAGVSAGIDAALHLVERLRGEEARATVARYMEYGP
jgi:transcriptional regulator GlxA family with amidase domain